MENFYSIKKEHYNIYEIEKSKFITYLFPVETEEEAVDKIQLIKKKNFDATHNVSAFYIRNQSFYKKYSDDGEPSGTAGMPTLQIILNKDIIDVCVITTRYFGGIKLGAGGLVRAYSESANLAFNSAEIIKFEKMTNYNIEISYDLFGNVKYYLEQNSILLSDIEYMEKVVIDIYLNSNQNKIIDDIINLTSANIKIDEMQTKYISHKDNKIIATKELL